MTDWGRYGRRTEGRKNHSYLILLIIKLFHFIPSHFISIKTAVFSDPPVSTSSRPIPYYWPIPYCWQYKESDSHQWNNFDHVDNIAIEKLFCDVENLQVNLVLKGASSLR